MYNKEFPSQERENKNLTLEQAMGTKFTHGVAFVGLYEASEPAKLCSKFGRLQ